VANEHWDMLSFEQGILAVVAREGCLVRICFESSPDGLSASIKRSYPEAKQSSQMLTRESLRQLTEYFLGKRRTFNVPLANDSLTPFAREVHQALLRVPYGSVVTYGELAAMAGSPRAARAVGGVMASNPFPLIVPCHRVVNADGRIGQYSAAHGTRTKAWLIDFERGLVAVT
jgi:methylated-DNA-[protein]-cysteine S-methyltransferase